MANIVIKKKLTLEFLGKEYADSYLVFKSLPVVKYKEFTEKLKSVGKDDNVKATQVMLDTLKDSFIEGSFVGEAVQPDDLGELDGATILKCFQILTGQSADEEGNPTIDPKDENSSTKQSSTEQQPPTS